MSFLSGLALEVASSLAVAFVAVSIGLRLIDGSVALGPGLMALLLAPEAFLPIRQVGTNFHASNEGVMASSLLLDVIEESGTDAIPDEGMSDRFPSGAITHLTGPSGSGKTTLLNRIRRELPASVVTWMPQGSKLLSGSIRRNIIGPASDADPENLKLAVQLAALDDVELDSVVSDSGAGLSGGQVQRVALARAFYRALTRDSDWLLLDEPLSALDAERSNVVQAALQEFAGQGRRVLLSSHKPLTVAVRTLAVEDV
jgi:ATP-binding cassette subfamily C protein CydD